MKIRDMLNNIDKEIDNLKLKEEKNILSKAKRIREREREKLIENVKLIDLNRYIEITEYQRAMRLIRPKDKIKLKQMELV